MSHGTEHLVAAITEAMARKVDADARYERAVAAVASAQADQNAANGERAAAQAQINAAVKALEEQVAQEQRRVPA